MTHSTRRYRQRGLNANPLTIFYFPTMVGPPRVPATTPAAAAALSLLLLCSALETSAAAAAAAPGAAFVVPSGRNNAIGGLLVPGTPTLACIEQQQQQQQQQLATCAGRAPTSTALSMGLRSFIKRKLGKGESGDDSSDGGKRSKKGGTATDGSSGDDASAAAAASSSSKSRPPIRDISSDVSAPSRPAVTVQSGSSVPSTIMETFLPKKKSGGGGGSNNNKKKKGAAKRGSSSSDGDDGKVRSLSEPIRQALPDASDAEETVQERIARVKAGNMSEEEKEAFLASALYKTPLPRAGDGRGGKPIRQALPNEDGDQDSGKSKPTDVASILAFASRTERARKEERAYGTGGARGATTMGNAAIERLNEDEKKRFLDSVMNPDRFKTYGVNPGVGVVDEPPEEVEDVGNTDGDGEAVPKKSGGGGGIGSIFGGAGGLADRLEAAAHAREKEEQEKRERAEREARERRLQMEEELRAREAELARKLEEEQQRKREEEERRKAEAEAAERAERERLEEMQRKQDEYWAKKLEEEARKREERFTAEQREEEARIEREEREKAAKDLERRAREDLERARIREEERLREDPHEGDILQEARNDALKDRQFTRAIMDDTAGLPSRQPAADVSSSAFVNEQQKKQAEVDRFKKEQEDRLRALNSPLPSPGSPPRVIPPSPAPMPMNTPSSAKSLSELSSLLNGPIPAAADPPATPPPPPAPASPLPSLAEMTRLKRDDPPSSPLPSLAEMTRLRKDSDTGARSNIGAAAPKASSGGRQVVRQQLPLLDDDDDVDYDGDEYLRNGPNVGMSIGDVMKNIGQKKSEDDGGSSSGGGQTDAEKKAMMWGIDMSKYNDLD